MLGATVNEAGIRQLYQDLGFQPNDSQEPILFARDHNGEIARAIAVSGGEQAGKSLCTARYMAPRMLWASIDTPGWVVAPDYAQAHNEIRYMIEDYSRLGLLDAANTNTPKDGMQWITLKGGVKIHSLSAQDEAKIAGERPFVVALVEAGQCTIETYERCFGRTAPAGGYLFVNGTLEKVSLAGEWYPDLLDAWKGPNGADGVSFELPSWSNTVLYPGGWQNPEIQRQHAALPNDTFLERFGGRRAPPRNIVIPEFRQAYPFVQHIQLGGTAADPRTVILPKDQPLQLWIDPGYGGAYAVLFVALAEDDYGDPRVYVVDEIYVQHQYHEQVIQMAKTHRYWGNVTHAVMDPAGKQHAAAQSAYEWWKADPRKKGAGLQVQFPAKQVVQIHDGVDRVRTFLVPDQRLDPPQPRMVLSHRCQKFAWELSRGYRFPEGVDGKPRDRRNPIPENNHAISAAWFGLITNFGLVQRHKRRGSLPRTAPGWER